MSQRKCILSLLIAVLVTIVSHSAFAAQEENAEGKLGWPGEVFILSGPNGGQWNALGNEMAKILTEAGIPTRTQVGGGVENLRLVGEGKADIGFSLYSFLGAAQAGEIELPEVNLDNAVILANIYPQVLYIIVRKDVAEKHNLKTLADLLKITDTLRFDTLPKGTGSEFIFNMLLKNAYRTNYDELAKQNWDIRFESYAEITRLLLAKELDVCAYTAGPNTYLIPTLIEKNVDAIFLPVDEEMLNLMTHQFMTITYVIQKGDYEYVPEDVLTLGDFSCLVTQNNLPEELIYNINKILWENKDRLEKITKDIADLSPRYAIAGQSSVHPGSKKFWTTPEMLELKKAKK